ncbi:MAG: response regulator [Novosphingobium sp.]|nr:response regulator [Novosphingobium sp.]
MGAQAILLVEDEILIRILVADLLRDAGYEVAEAASGEDGLRLLESGGDFDLLMTDIKMPGALDGLALATHWKNLFPGRPVLVSSGHLTADRMHPADELIVKPYSDARLLATVERLIGPPCQPRAPRLTA